MKNTSTLTCPECGHKQKMQMPFDRCIPFYKCKGCGSLIAAKKNCCVFCDYADKKCPVSHEA